MKEQEELSSAIPHTGRSRRVAALVVALVVVAAVIGVVAWGFHGRQIRRDASALTASPAHP